MMARMPQRHKPEIGIFGCGDFPVWPSARKGQCPAPSTERRRRLAFRRPAAPGARKWAELLVAFSASAAFLHCAHPSALESAAPRVRGSFACRIQPAFGATMSKTVTQIRTKTQTRTERPRLHKVILFNDDYTPRDFVVQVLKAVFRLNETQALSVMMTAHRKGVCVVAVFARDIAETKAARGTEAGAAKGYPLRFGTEPEE
jgi:ATP-dependent Clp protease adaptor protein ClpS